MFAVGLMSGTSLDGIDAALVEICGSYTDTKLRLINFINMEMPVEIKNEIKIACSLEGSTSELICSLNFKLGYLFSKAVKKVCESCGFPMEKLDFIASHGQTIFHIPRAYKNFIPSTLQIGEASIIAYETNTKVVSNFRVMDMAAGGQGAPLVPYSEFIIYGSKDKNIALQNIGGIGNVTVIPKTRNMEDVFAFDTGPGNMIIDDICQRLFNKKYDDRGRIAGSGKVNVTMLKELLNHSFIMEAPPKSTGREEFGGQFTDKILCSYYHLKKEDILATVTAFTARSITENYKKFVLPKVRVEEVILGGGGAYNDFLVDEIRKGLNNIRVLTQEELGFSSDAKEAIAFAVLGNETLNNNFSNVPTATGAKGRVILGNITPVIKNNNYRG